MIHVNYQKGELCVSCDVRHPYYQRAYLVLRSLLSVRSSGPSTNSWTISYDDFQTLKIKLDSLGWLRVDL